MKFVSFRALLSGQIRKRHAGIAFAIMVCAVLTAALTVAGFAQDQAPSRSRAPELPPKANPMPDANEQIAMQQRNAQKKNFEAANAARLKQLMQASDALQTLAMALKAEVDQSGNVNQNTIHKAETIEKLARIVKDRMSLTVAAN